MSTGTPIRGIDSRDLRGSVRIVPSEATRKYMIEHARRREEMKLEHKRQKRREKNQRHKENKKKILEEAKEAIAENIRTKKQLNDALMKLNTLQISAGEKAAENMTMKEQLDNIKEEVEEVQSCGICCELVNDTNEKHFIAFIPCGHKVCNNCQYRIPQNCPFCNKEINGRLRLY